MLTKALLLFLCASVASSTQCVDEDGKNVDWWFIYKMPNGFDYAYLDSRDKATSLEPFEDRTLDRLDGALGGTLHQIYVNKKGLGYVLYNDEEPESEGKSLLSKAIGAIADKINFLKGSSGAHAKGVVATDGSTGFWLVHSVPKFPDLGPPSFTWTADDTYGQSFLCISLARHEVDTVGEQLQHYHPHIFDSNMPTAVGENVPVLAALVEGKRKRGPNVAELTSLGGHTFLSFAKDAAWGGDLYVDLVAPTLKVGFNWETWRRGDSVPSHCGGHGTYATVNVLTMRFGRLEFSFTHDHAKIGVATSASGDGGYVCVGDINQMISQRKRGGGTVCFKTRTLWKALSDSVGTTEEC